MNKIFEILKSVENTLIKQVSLDFKRNNYENIDWSDEMI
jgi:hypothetical protein